MRICHILESAGGGSGQVVIDLLTCGINSGDDVTLIYSPLREEPGFLSALGALQGRVKIHKLTMKRSVGPADALAALKLFLLLKRIGPFDVVHAHSSKAGALARLVKIIMPKMKLVYTPHAFMTMAPDASPLYGKIEKLLSPLSNAIICVSNFEKRHGMEKIGIAEKRLHVVPNGVQPGIGMDKAAARARIGFGDDAYILGFVGRLVPQKNPLRLIEAFIIAAGQMPQLRLAIVGEGPLREKAQELFSAARMEHYVNFLGNQKGREFIPGFDCLVCSSDYEAFSVVFLEALVAGVPVVTTPVGGAEEAIIESNTGFIAKDFTAQALATALLKMAALDDSVRAAMSKAAKTHAENFNLEKLGERTKAVYKTL